MIRSDPDAGSAEARFTMLETIREFTLVRLVEDGEERMVWRAQAAME